MSNRILQQVDIPIRLFLVRGNAEQNASEFRRAIGEIVARADRRIGDEAYRHMNAAVLSLADQIVEIHMAAERARPASAPEAS